MIWIFEGELVIICIVGHVGIIVHYQKFPHRNIANQFFVFREMFEQNRKSHQFMKLCISASRRVPRERIVVTTAGRPVGIAEMANATPASSNAFTSWPLRK